MLFLFYSVHLTKMQVRQVSVFQSRHMPKRHVCVIAPRPSWTVTHFLAIWLEALLCPATPPAVRLEEALSIVGRGALHKKNYFHFLPNTRTKARWDIVIIVIVAENWKLNEN